MKDLDVKIHNDEEIAKMRIAGRLAAQVLEMIAPYVKPGISTDELNTLCHNYIVEQQQAIPAPLNYRGFPKSICTSVNHQVCHGIPGPRKLKSGDIVNIDITVIKDGFHGDTSVTFLVGKTNLHTQRLVRVTQECLYLAIQQVKPGACISDVGRVIEEHAKKNHYSVVRDYCGHGIGETFHTDPQVLHYYAPSYTLKLEPGMIFTIEPMINAGGYAVRLLPDDWTAVTRDHSLSAQWEHTILVTPAGHEILTLRQDEQVMPPPSP